MVLIVQAVVKGPYSYPFNDLHTINQLLLSDAERHEPDVFVSFSSMFSCKP